MDKKRIPIADDGTKVYQPHQVVPMWEHNSLTNNYTAQNGRVYNQSEMDAECAKKWVEENKK
ncbi:MAG: hypothetical protein ACI4I6_06170 [Hominimerdicola sp.]